LAHRRVLRARLDLGLGLGWCKFADPSLSRFDGTDRSLICTAIIVKQSTVMPTPIRYRFDYYTIQDM